MFPLDPWNKFVHYINRSNDNSLFENDIEKTLFECKKYLDPSQIPLVVKTLSECEKKIEPSQIPIVDKILSEHFQFPQSPSLKLFNASIKFGIYSEDYQPLDGWKEPLPPLGATELVKLKFILTTFKILPAILQIVPDLKVMGINLTASLSFIGEELYSFLGKEYLIKAYKEIADKLKISTSLEPCDITTNSIEIPVIHFCLPKIRRERVISFAKSFEAKLASYVSSILEEFIEQVGSKNVVQVTADNTNANLAAWNLVSSKYPHIYFQGCVVHALNLLLKDWAHQPRIKKYVKDAEVVVKFFKKRHMPLAVFRKYETRFSLLKSLETRFASYFIMIDRLLQVKGALKQSVVDLQWVTYVNTLDDSDKVKSRTKSWIVYNTVVNKHFWDRLTIVRDLTAPVVYGLCDLDAKTPCMEKVLHIMRTLQKHVFGLRGAPFYLSIDLAIPLEKSFVERREMGETDLHYVGTLLNPYLLHDKELAHNQDATGRCKRVIMKICNPDEYSKVVKEFVAFRHREFPFHNMLEPDEQILSAHAWRDFEGACGRLIAPIAKRILAQPVSSSACKQNWSSYSYVHNKSRNKLAKTRAADLVYVYTNSKVVATSKNKDEKKWYKENIDSESSEAGSDAKDVDEGPHPLDGDVEGNAIHNWHDEPYGSPDQANEEFGGNSRDMYNFYSDEENDGYGGDVPSIAKFVDGSGFLNSETILPPGKDAFEKIVESNGTTLHDGGHGGMDKVIGTLQSLSTGGVQEKEKDKQNDEGRCHAEDEEFPNNTNVPSVEVLESKNNNESSSGDDNPIAMKKSGD